MAVSFESDYIAGAHPEILRKLTETNLESLPGYGSDPYCESAKRKILEACGLEGGEVEFLTGGTQANAVVISTMLADHEGVVAAATGHISSHEAGAIEYTGHEVLELPQENGKIRPETLSRYLSDFFADDNHEHMTFPGMVYLSWPTEYGTLYTKAELEAISGICRQYGIPLFLDGARLAYGLMSRSADLTLPDIARLCDVFYIGGTKVGALCGEAVVFTKGNKPKHFLTSVKKRGALLAKGRLLGVQFDALFTDELYFRIGRHAIDMAEKMKDIFRAHGLDLYLDSPTNQQFVILENERMQAMREQVAFSFWEKYDETHTVVRFATGWSTTEEDLAALEKACERENRPSVHERENRPSVHALLGCLVLLLCLILNAGPGRARAENWYTGLTAEEIVSELTLEQKASQMVQPACYNINADEMAEYCYGSILSQGAHLDAAEWRDYTAWFQQAALKSEAGIPYIYGQDDVHGVNYCVGAVYFPQNIGLGAAGDEELMYRIGQITADEAKLCHMLWNFAPVVAQSADPRWGRTYESYGADTEKIRKLSVAYTKGLVESGMVVCPKHFFGDGNVAFGTGEGRDQPRLMDRGDARLTEEQIAELLSVYQAQIDAGAQTVMVSFSSLNGVKMHENKQYIDRLKNEMGFTGFVVSDWEGVSQTSPEDYNSQVAAVVNAGVDMLMEADHFREARAAIISGVEIGRIPEERVDDAVRRIIQVKMDAGVLDDPLCEKVETAQTETGSGEYRAVAEEAVEKSLVLLKNEGGVLPLKSGTAVYITGPAADHDQAQCGGWTVGWTGSPEKEIPGVTSILEGFRQKADEYGIRVITKESEADQADVILLVLGEESYAEWLGDTADLDLCGALGLMGNETAIRKAEQLGKPVIACIVAGRQVLISRYADKWDAAVMCYLPGSEGQGVANVLCGKKPFTGKLPSPWYASLDQIGTEECWLPTGYGLTAE